MAEKEEEQGKAAKAVYERPRIEETAGFERLALACARTEAEFECSAGPFSAS